MNVFQELHLRGIDCTIRRGAVEQHIGRVGQALDVLNRHAKAWEIWANVAASGMGRRRKIASQAKALVKHDRIMRGDV
ncbi:hypothetical protein [Pseudomonas coleopterorum]|uniref:hypothetical protein n=1 Tax=Pseudomonas coleopterorum TaxID=1605838 RepID=UPI000B8A188C|nr:hypothetical protein [Pseudomonas coleopterorum]